MAGQHRQERADTYGLLETWTRNCLAGDGSLFAPGRAIWTQGNLGRLRESFTEQPDESSDPFLVKLSRQLGTAPDDVVLLFAELLTMHLLIAADITGATKRHNIEAVLAEMTTPVEIPEEIDRLLDAGLVTAGTAYRTYRPAQLWFFIDAMLELKRLDPAERASPLGDPWEFRALLDRVPVGSAHSQYHALLHMVHPEVFEDCVSREHKRQIARAFAHLARDAEDDVDLSLLRIREALEGEAGRPISFYDEPYRSQWSSERIRAWEVLSEVVPHILAQEDYDAHERDYKVELAADLAVIYRDREAGWGLEALRRIGRTNLVNFRPLGRLRQWASAHPQALDSAVAALVDAEDVFAAIDAFAEAVRDALDTRGGRLSLAVVLLMGIDATRYVPWRSEATRKYQQLLAFESPPDQTDGEHYRDYLEMLDMVREELARRGVELRDRLDAQSLLWTLSHVEADAPPLSALPTAARRKLLTWRGDELAPEDGHSGSESTWRAERIRQITAAARELGAVGYGQDPEAVARSREFALQALMNLRHELDLEAFAASIRASDEALPHTRQGSHQTFLQSLAGRAEDHAEAARVVAEALTAPTSLEDVPARLLPLVELAERTGTPHAPAAGMTPLVASAFWHLQDPGWLPLLAKVEEALSLWGWLPDADDAGQRYLRYLDALDAPGSGPETITALRWVGGGWFPGLDPTLPERLADVTERLDAGEDGEMVADNLRHVLADLKVLDRCASTSLSQQLGHGLDVVTSSMDPPVRRDAFIAWRPRGTVANPPPDLRVWATSEGVAIGIHPGGGRDRLTEAHKLAVERAPEDVEFLSVVTERDGRRRFVPRGRGEAEGDFLVGRWLPGAEALGRPELVDDMVALLARLKPILGAWLASLGAGLTPQTPELDDDRLAALVRAFAEERGYPSAKDRQRIEARAQLRSVVAPEALENDDLEGLRRVINSSAGGRAGPQAVLNASIRDASPERLDALFDALRYLLWSEEDPVSTRIDRLLDHGDLGLPGLGESVVVKLLSVAHPTEWVPAFPLRGDMGKLKLLEALGLSRELVGTVGEQHVAANRAIRERLEPYFPGDTWGMKDFAYWLASREDVDSAVAEVDLIDAAARDLCVSSEFLREIAELLREKKQVIFYGPPGTGKTYLARRLARALVGEDESRYRLVQFHPSYAYEDFFEGYRPLTDHDGRLTYELRPGPFARMAEAAEAAPAAEHVMIVDEINRANLPKVLGELLFLLEYRDEPAYTQYRSDEPFSVPERLYLIGTMNTADRSIALVDAALRRRFHFVGFFPHEGEIAGLLRRWLDANDEPAWVADLLDQVNDELRRDLGGPHLQIGPSYFMQPGLDESRLRRIWRYSVHPYIEEQLFGQQERIDRYAFDAVWSRFRLDTDEEADTDGDDD